MNRPLLSICIPTYNRAAYLPTCLDSIVSQLNNATLQEEVEIVIADNASTDGTENVVKHYVETYKNVRIVYFNNQKNIGFDRSFTKLIEKSSGVYCLSIGDDDAFFDNTIPMILSKIKEVDVPFFGLNCWGYDSDLKNPVLPHPNLKIETDLYYKKLSDYIRTIKKYTNLVGIFVGLSTQLFKRDPYVAYNGKEKFFDTLVIYMYINLSVYKDSPFVTIAQPVIKTRSSNIRWDVFAGLETIQGRIQSTLEIVTWVRDMFNLPISNTSFYIYFYTREYWFTFKEIIKRKLSEYGLGGIIAYYRKIR
jgi:abequosyltransferase